MRKTAFIALFLLYFFVFFVEASTNTQELDSAISWMNQYGLTKYSNKTDFEPNRNIQRNEAAKIFSQYAKNVNGELISETTDYCKNLKDIPNNSLSGYIMDVCSKGYIHGNKGIFNPTSSLSNEQAIAIVIRLLEGKKDEIGSRWSDVYYKRADAIGLLDNMLLNNRSAFITRGNLGILMYKIGKIQLSLYDEYSGYDGIKMCDIDITKPSFAGNLKEIRQTGYYECRISSNSGFNIMVLNYNNRNKEPIDIGLSVNQKNKIFNAYNEYIKTKNNSLINDFIISPEISTNIEAISTDLIKNNSGVVVGVKVFGYIYQDCPGDGVVLLIFKDKNGNIIYMKYTLFGMSDLNWQDYVDKNEVCSDGKNAKNSINAYLNSILDSKNNNIIELENIIK